jgi:colanic acid biosynthesis glycosyl transferase WcaI
MLASGRPILVQADPGTELYDLLNGVAVLAPAGDVDGLMAAIADARTRPYDVDRYAEIALLFARQDILPRFREILCAEKKRVRALRSRRRAQPA